MPRTLTAYTLGPSLRHGVGVFATRELIPYTRIGHVHLFDAGSIERFISLPITGHLVGDRVWAATGGFPMWYVNYGRPPNIEMHDDGDVLTTLLVLEGDELLLALPSVQS